MKRPLFLILGLSLTACSGNGDDPAPELIETVPASIPAADVEQGILIVEPRQVRQWQEDGTEFVLVDARDRVQYGREHVEGAINIPYIDIRPGANLPPKDAKIVVYCSDPACPISRYAYETLERFGFRELYDMRAGLQGWKAAGLPTEIDAEPESQ